MDSFTLDFGQLAQETMNFNTERIEQLLDGEQFRAIPEGPGILFSVQKGRGTFGLRGVPALSLSDKMEELKQNEDRWVKLKISSLDELEFFETESYEGAEVLIDTMMNRRYPYLEDMVCNISDPGFSWWGVFEGTSFHVHFLSHQVERSGQLVRLGPIGDRKIAAKRFQQFFLLFSQYIQKENFVCTEKSLSYNVDQLSGIFFDLKNLFFRGEFSETLKTLTSLDKTLYYYLEELAAARKFWLTVEKLIEAETEQTTLFFA